MHDPVPAGRPQRRLRARARRSPRPGTRRRPTRRSKRPATSPPTSSELAGVARRCRRPRAAAARVLPPVRRAGLPPAADRRAEASSTSTASSRRPTTRRRRSSASCCCPEVAAVPLPRGRRRRRRLRRRRRGSRSACGIRCPTRSCCEAAAAGKLATPRAGRRAGRADARRPADAVEAPRVLPAVAEGRSGRRTWPRTRSSSPASTQAVAADLRTSLELFLDDVVWSEASDFRQLLLADYAVPQRPAGEVLRRRPARRRAVPEGDARRRRAGRAC